MWKYVKIIVLKYKNAVIHGYLQLGPNWLVTAITDTNWLFLVQLDYFWFGNKV